LVAWGVLNIGGVSQKMLTQQLRELERDGTVRRALRGNSAQRRLSLTTSGEALRPTLKALRDLGREHGSAPIA